MINAFKESEEPTRKREDFLLAVDLYEKALRALTSKNAYSSKIRENSIPNRTSCVRRYAASCS